MSAVREFGERALPENLKCSVLFQIFGPSSIGSQKFYVVLAGEACADKSKNTRSIMKHGVKDEKIL